MPKHNNPLNNWNKLKITLNKTMIINNKYKFKCK